MSDTYALKISSGSSMERNTDDNEESWLKINSEFLTEDESASLTRTIQHNWENINIDNIRVLPNEKYLT